MKDTIEVTPHGVIFRLPMSLSLLGRAGKITAAILDVPERRLVKHPSLDRRVNGYAVTTEAGVKRWIAELNEQPIPRVTGLAWLDEWIDRGEVGASSATIADYYCRGACPSGRRAAPLDADDFRRCHLLLELAAKKGEDWCERLATDPPPEFARVAPHWERLTALFVAGDYRAVNALLEGK